MARMVLKKKILGCVALSKTETAGLQELCLQQRSTSKLRSVTVAAAEDQTGTCLFHTPPPPVKSKPRSWRKADNLVFDSAELPRLGDGVVPVTGRVGTWWGRTRGSSEVEAATCRAQARAVTKPSPACFGVWAKRRGGCWAVRGRGSRCMRGCEEASPFSLLGNSPRSVWSWIWGGILLF